jgi:hypothetical protein
MSAPELTVPTCSPEWLAARHSHLLQEAHAVSVPSLQDAQTLADRLPASVAEAVDRLGDHLTTERRQVVGHTGQKGTVVVLAPEREAVVGRLHDRSPGEIAVILAAPVVVGSILLIMVNEAARVVVQLTAEVRHCQAAGPEWVVRCDVLGFVLSGG